MIGWLAAASLGVFLLSDELVKVGAFGESCKQYGLASWNCGVAPKFFVWVPDTFIYFLKLPFAYDGSTDILGADYAMMWTGSPVAYAFAVVATNYWVWKLNQL